MSFRGTFSALSINGYQSGVKNYWFPIQTINVNADDVAMSENGDYIALTNGDIYFKSGSTWTLQQSLGLSLPDSPTISINANGDTLAIGNLVYVRSGTTWSLQATLIAGNRVSLDNTGNYLILGNPNFNNPALPFTAEGRAYFYTRTGTVWTLRQTLNPNFVYNNLTNFGSSVSFSGNSNYVAIGAPRTATGTFPTPQKGMVYIYTRTGNTLNLSVTAEPDQPGNNDLGAAVNMDYTGNIVATDDTWGTTSPRGIWYFDQSTSFAQTFISLAQYNTSTVQMLRPGRGLKSNHNSSEIFIGLEKVDTVLNLNNYSGQIAPFQNIFGNTPNPIDSTFFGASVDVAALANYAAILQYDGNIPSNGRLIIYTRNT